MEEAEEGETREGGGRGDGEAICYLICSRLKSLAEDFHLLHSLFLLLFLLSVFM